ncbi:enoyl-CoA hydratase/isomerase family protein [Ideonella sp. A 288]|uniref:enoyl-CoA hydratase/isomerase family protein n=1 Tax=Ideonella sp. A 288 TaxID=1962181 RepID=UPI000B4B6EE0|nr:enoyl-CoA hydratase-related protein [Ideonella sp. A 288]
MAAPDDTGTADAARQTLLVKVDAGVWHVTLNRPESRNAMSLQMVRELRAVLAEAEATAGSRVLVLRGAGGHFCAGGDLKDMAAARARLSDGTGGGTDPIAEVNAAFGELCVAYANTGLALVAVVEGTVMGGGFGLACVADVVVAGQSTVFRLPETSLGVVPAQIAPFLVERLGFSDARRLAITGGKLDADAALRLGLVHEVHAAGALDSALHHVLHGILNNAPGAVAATKALMAKARFHPPEALVAEAAAVFSRAVLGAEGIEGTTAFLQKRKPSWAPT